jgi:hypothetical protein
MGRVKYTYVARPQDVMRLWSIAKAGEFTATSTPDQVLKTGSVLVVPDVAKPLGTLALHALHELCVQVVRRPLLLAHA